MKILVACEESQEVCKVFREKGHKAYSCGIQECSGGHPEWHIQGDVLPLLNPSKQWISGDSWIGFKFRTMDGVLHCIEGKWDLIIAHPPYTYLTNGDVIKSMFPDCKDWKAKIEDNDGEVYEVHFVQLPNSMTVNKYEEKWWNVPYRQKVRKYDI